MNVEIKGVHYALDEKTENLIQKKMKRLKHVEDLIVDLTISVSRDSNGIYNLSSDIHFRWGQNHHIKQEGYELFKGIEILFDKIEQKTTREKEKIQAHT